LRQIIHAGFVRLTLTPFLGLLIIKPYFGLSESEMTRKETLGELLIGDIKTLWRIRNDRKWMEELREELGQKIDIFYDPGNPSVPATPVEQLTKPGYVLKVLTEALNQNRIYRALNEYSDFIQNGKYSIGQDIQVIFYHCCEHVRPEEAILIAELVSRSSVFTQCVKLNLNDLTHDSVTSLFKKAPKEDALKIYSLFETSDIFTSLLLEPNHYFYSNLIKIITEDMSEAEALGYLKVSPLWKAYEKDHNFRDWLIELEMKHLLPALVY